MQDATVELRDSNLGGLLGKHAVSGAANRIGIAGLYRRVTLSLPPLRDKAALAAITLSLASLAGCAHFTTKPLELAQTAAQIDARTLADEPLRAFIEHSQGHQIAPWPLHTWSLERLVLVAFYYSPDLDLARTQWNVAQAAARTAGARPNPTLSLVPEYSTNPPDGVSAWLPAAALELHLETAGKRGHRVAHALALAEVARWNIATTAWEVRTKLLAALLDYSGAQRREELLTEQLAAQGEVVRLQQGRVFAGALAASDIIPARVLLARTRMDLQATRAQLVEARARTADALGLPLAALSGAHFDIELDTSASAELSTDEMRARALRERSEILGALAEYAASQAALQLQIARQFPDVHLGPGYQWDQGENKWHIGLSLELPVFDHNQGPIAESEARRTECAQRVLALQSRIIHEIDRTRAALTAARSALDAAEQLLTEQRAQLHSSEAQLAAGAADSLDVAARRMDVAAAQSLAFEARVQLQHAVVAAENAVQHPSGGNDHVRAALAQLAATQRSPR